MNAATRDMAAIAEAARCAASKCSTKKASHHAPGPRNPTASIPVAPDAARGIARVLQSPLQSPLTGRASADAST